MDILLEYKDWLDLKTKIYQGLNELLLQHINVQNDDEVKKIKPFIQQIRDKKWNNFELKNLINVLFELDNVFFGIFPNESSKNRYGYIPFNIKNVYNTLKNIDKKYNFYHLGCGIGTKCLLAELLGFNIVKGFEIDSRLIEKSKLMGLSDLIEEKNIMDLDNLKSPKIIYYYQPIYNNETMYEFELEIFDMLEVNDILISHVTYNRDNKKYALPIDLINRTDLGFNVYQKVDIEDNFLYISADSHKVKENDIVWYVPFKALKNQGSMAQDYANKEDLKWSNVKGLIFVNKENALAYLIKNKK